MITNKSCIIFLTGLPCSGKSTISNELSKQLLELEVEHWKFDGDTFRKDYCQDLGFSPADRKENIRRVTTKALQCEKNGFMVLCSFVSPYREMRKTIRKQAKKFVEVFVNADLEVCMDRDIKGMYRKAILKEIEEFTGYSAPYEKPINPEIECKTDYETVEESVKKIMDYLKQEDLL